MRRRLRSAAFPIHRHCRSRSWPWTRGWSRWLTTWPTGSGSTAASRRGTRTCSGGRSRSRSRVARLLRDRRHVPALDALLVAARVPQDRRGHGARGPGADRLCRDRPAGAGHRRRRASSPADRPVRRARALRAADGRVPDRHALRRPPRLRAPAPRLAHAPQRALGADRRRRQRRPPAAAGELRKNPELGYRPVGFVDDDDKKGMPTSSAPPSTSTRSSRTSSPTRC